MNLIDKHGEIVAQASKAAFLSNHGIVSTIVCDSRKAATIVLAELHRASHKPMLGMIRIMWPTIDGPCIKMALDLMESGVAYMEEALADAEGRVKGRAK